MYNLIINYSWMKSKIHNFVYDPFKNHQLLMNVIPENFIIVSKTQSQLKAVNADGDTIRLEVEAFV